MTDLESLARFLHTHSYAYSRTLMPELPEDAQAVWDTLGHYDTYRARMRAVARALLDNPPDEIRRAVEKGGGTP